MSEAEVDSWHQAGFTVPMSSRFDPDNPQQAAHLCRLLDWAQARGMKLIVPDPRCLARVGVPGALIPSDYADGARAAIAQFGQHPALFGFYVGDEPEAHDKDAFFECSRVQKGLAPHLHPLINLLPYYDGALPRAGATEWPGYLDEFAHKSQADLISYDCYTQMYPGESGWDNYYENLRLYREASQRNGLPFWNTLLAVGHWNYRCPNADEIRWQFNTTLASGAHGILWFHYYLYTPTENYRQAPVNEFWEKTVVYDHLRHVQTSFHRRYGNLFSRMVSTRVTFYPRAYGGGEVFTPNALVRRLLPDTSGHPLLLGEFMDADGQEYLMLVNHSMTDNVRVGLTFAPEAQLFSWDWNGLEKPGYAYTHGGYPSERRDEYGLTLYHWLAPGQEAVYRVVR